MFKHIVLVSAFILAICAAIYSITGISQLFVGAQLNAALLAGGIELAKLVSVSILYRYKDLPKLLRIYMVFGVITVMSITSMGIYGYLSSAYAVGASDIQNKLNVIASYVSQQSETQSNIMQIRNRISELQSTRSQQENRIDTLIAKNRSITSQQIIIKNQDAEISQLQKQLTSFTHTSDSLISLKTSTINSISTSSKIGTFYYISNIVGIPLDTLVKWFILLLVLVFDPMSISLFIAYNFIVLKEQRNKNVSEIQTSHIPISTENVPSTLIETLEEIPSTKLETSDIPYYVHPNYDWKNDKRWRDDPHARAHFQRLGINPLDKK